MSTDQGPIFDFALNAIAGRAQEEFAGVTFAPGGKVLFVNIQASSGLTFAIWAHGKRGVLLPARSVSASPKVDASSAREDDPVSPEAEALLCVTRD